MKMVSEETMIRKGQWINLQFQKPLNSNYVGCSIPKQLVITMKVPKEVTTYCPKCKTHQAHAISLYKAGKRRALAKGERSHRLREMKGYGGQKYARQRDFAKTTKKQTLKLKCKKCGYTRHQEGMRLKKLTME